MERPTKRRRVLRQVQHQLEEEIPSIAERPLAQEAPMGKDNPLRNQLPIRAAASASLDPPILLSRRDALPPADQGKLKAHRLHPRNLNLYQNAGSAEEPVVQPVQTAVASFVNVVLESGGTSVGDVLVPAAFSVFNVDGYGPVTLNRNPPPNATPTPPSENPTSTSHPHRHSHAPQQTPQPSPKEPPQVSPSAAASQNAPPQQNPMTIQVPGSSSQVILSSPPTPLPPSPPNSSSTATVSESYFGSSLSQITSSTQTSSGSSITSSQTSATASQSPRISIAALTAARGNFSISCRLISDPT